MSERAELQGQTGLAATSRANLFPQIQRRRIAQARSRNAAGSVTLLVGIGFVAWLSVLALGTFLFP